MISYQELVASLTEWRVRQGLSTGPTDYLGEPMPMPLVGPPQPEPEPAEIEEYAELADSEILSEEPDEASAYGEIGGDEAYPGEEPVSFPDTEAAAPDSYGGAMHEDAAPAEDAWGAAPSDSGGWDQAPAEPAAWDQEPAAADSWDPVQPEPAPYADAQPEMPSWEVEEEVPAYGEGDNEVTEFAPPPEHDEGQEYADVMEEPASADLSAQTWDTEAEAEAVSADDGGFGGGGLYEEDPYAMPDAGQPQPPEAGGPPPLDAAEEGDSTMDVDPDEILSADDLPPPTTEAGEIGGSDDPFAEPPPLEPPPEGEPAQYDPSAKPDPEKQ